MQGTGNVELKFSGSNTLTGSGGSAGIQKNDEDSYGKANTGTLTITADSRSDTLDVKVDEWALGNDNQGAAIGGGGRKTDEKSGGCGTKNIVIEGNGTVNTNAQIGSGYRGGAATGIVIRGNAVVNVGKFGIGGCGFSSWDTEKPGETDVTITGNAKVTVQNGTIGSGVRREQLCGDAKINISGNAEVNVFGGDNAATIGSGEGGDANVTITGNAKVTAEQVSDWYGGGAGIGGGANGKGHVTIGGKAQVQATGSAEKDDHSRAYGAGAAIGDGGTAGESGSTVQNGKNQFTIANDIEDNAEIKMTNKGNDSSNTVTQTRRNGEWVTSGEQTPEECDHSNPFVEITVAPTCTESGYTVSKCTRCGKETGEHTNIVAPLGHEYKNGVCTRCGAPEPQENGGSSSAAPNYTVTGAETYETSVVDGRYIIAVPSEDAALNAVLGDLRAIKHRVPMWWCSAPGAGSPALSSTRCWPWAPMLPPLCLPTTAARPGSPSTAQLITS